MQQSQLETLGGVRPLSLYCQTIAQSGERKSSCDAPLMAAVRAFEKEQAEAQRDAVTSWQNTHALWKGERERILSEAKKGKGEKRTASLADLSALGPEPAAPPSTDRTVSEPTFEGLTRLFAYGQPALGLFSDEGGQFLGGHAMNSDNRQKTLAAMNDLWQGNPIRRTRAGEGHSVLFGRRLAIHLMVQPGVARTFMADPIAGDTGFLPRFLICEPPSTIGNRPHALTRPDDGRLASFAARLRGILETPLPMDAETRELSPRLLRLSGMARALLVAFSDWVEAQQAPGADLSHVTGYASKAAEQAYRIAGVLTPWCDLHAHEVTEQDMADGIELADYYLSEASRLANAATEQQMAEGIELAGYYLSEASRLANAAMVSVEVDRAEKLRKWLLEKWPEAEVTTRDVVNAGPNELRETPKARASLALLEKLKWLAPSRREQWCGAVAGPKPGASCGGQAMRFDLAKARAELEPEAATIAAPAPSSFVAKVAIVATPPAPKVEHTPRPSVPRVYPYGTLPGGHPRTWTGRIVSPTEWPTLSDWERDGSTGQAWNGLTRQWETLPSNEGNQP